MDLSMKVVSKLQKLQASAGISGNHTLKCLIHRTLKIFFLFPLPPSTTSENYAPSSTAERSRSGMEIPTTSLRGENDCFHYF